MNKKKLYESIMRNVAKEVKKALNKAYFEMNGDETIFNLTAAEADYLDDSNMLKKLLDDWKSCIFSTSNEDLADYEGGIIEAYDLYPSFLGYPEIRVLFLELEYERFKYKYSIVVELLKEDQRGLYEHIIRHIDNVLKNV